MSIKLKKYSPMVHNNHLIKYNSTVKESINKQPIQLHQIFTTNEAKANQ